MNSPHGDPPYDVQFLSGVASQLKELQRKALPLGLEPAIIDAARTIVRCLEANAANFGEPLYRLPALKLQVRVGIVQPLMVHFAVHVERPLVFIKGISAMPGHGL